MAKIKLPAPTCRLGYPDDKLKEILGDRYTDFMKWMRGQTFALCDGRSYNHELRQYEATGCGPHGYVYYSWDVDRFVKGLPVVDW
jgi:hypothetical protein